MKSGTQGLDPVPEGWRRNAQEECGCGGLWVSAEVDDNRSRRLDTEAVNMPRPFRFPRFGASTIVQVHSFIKMCSCSMPALDARAQNETILC